MNRENRGQKAQTTKRIFSRRHTQTDADDSADKPVGTKSAVPFGQRVTSYEFTARHKGRKELISRRRTQTDTDIVVEGSAFN